MTRRSFGTPLAPSLRASPCGAVAMLILPPLSPAIRTQRLLALTLADLRRLAKRASPGRQDDWESRGVARLLAMPEQAEPVERSQLVAAVAVGKEIVRLRHVAPRFVPGRDRGRGASSAGRRTKRRGDRAPKRHRPPARSPAPRRAASRIVLGLRASILVICGQLSEYPSYFRPAAPMRFNEINLFRPLRCADRGDYGGRLGDLSRRQASGRPPGLTQRVWHPALFELALYVIIVSSIVLMIARWSR